MSKHMNVSLTGVSMLKMIEAMSLFGSDDWDAFSNDVIDLYIKSKSKEIGKVENQVDVEGDFKVGQTYFHNWSNGKKTLKVIVTNNGVEILAGSDFEMKEVASLSPGHLEKRKYLLKENYIENGKFIRNYFCGSLSTAASIARGLQMSGKHSFKQNEKLDWTSIVVEALEDLGGEAYLEEIYKKIEDLHPDRLTPYYKNTVRGAIYKSSSDSEFFQGDRNLFKKIGHGRTGRWALHD